MENIRTSEGRTFLFQFHFLSYKRVHAQTHISCRALTCLHNLIQYAHVHTYTPHTTPPLLQCTRRKITYKSHYTGCSVSNIIHTHTHTCALGAHGPLCGCGRVQYGHIEEILPSQFPGTELGVTWLADTQPRWKECNSTPPASPSTAPPYPSSSLLAQLCEDRERNI